MALRWEDGTVEWNLRDHPIWNAYDPDGRPVGQVAHTWRDGTWTWEAHYWGDLPPGKLGVSLGADPRKLRGEWATAKEAMQAVDERHARTSLR